MSDLRKLRELSDVESPGVVRAAVREFRRRLIVRLAWAIAALAAGGVILVYAIDAVRPPLSRIDSAAAAPSTQALRVGTADVVLYRSARFGDDVGLHFIIVDPAASESACVDVTIRDGLKLIVDQSGGCGGSVGEHRFIVHPPASGRIQFTVTDASRQIGTFAVVVPASGDVLMVEDSNG